MVTASLGYSKEVWDAFRPAPRVSTWEWMKKHGRSPNGKEPFNPHQVPYFEEVANQVDNPRVRYIVMCWAARTFKTGGVHNTLLSLCARDPQEMMIVLPTDVLLVQQIDKKLYRMADNCKPLRDKLPSESKRNKRLFQFGGELDVIYGAISGSSSQLSDRSIRFIDCEEVDRFSDNSADEGDSLDQALKRTGEYPDFKAFISGTPERRAKSRVETWLRRGTNSRLWVPCPHCGEYQKLWFDLDGPKKTGLVFDPLESGEWNSDKARETVRYVCDHCEKGFDDVGRWRAIRGGKWAPRGCSIDRDGKTVGAPISRSTSIWSSRLSALYALAIPMGKIAEEWCYQHATPPGRRAFSQLTLGKGYEPEITQLEPEALGERIGTNVRRGTCPPWSRLLAVTADVQKDCILFLVTALGENCRTHVVDYGEVTELGQLREQVIDRGYPIDGGDLSPAIVGIDSGYRTSEIYGFCQANDRRHRQVWPLKGSDTDMMGKPWSVSFLGVTSKARRGASRQYHGKRLLWLNTDYWEEILHSALCDLQVADPGYLTLCEDAASDFAFLAELLNATQDDTVTDRRGNNRRLWIKREADKPNNFRDCLKMALCLLDIYLEQSRGRLPLSVASVAARAHAPGRPKPAPRRSFSAPIEPRPYGWIESMRHAMG